MGSIDEISREKLINSFNPEDSIGDFSGFFAETKYEKAILLPNPVDRLIVFPSNQILPEEWFSQKLEIWINS